MNHALRSSRAKRRGFTLTEIAIVLGIVGLILGAIWVAAAAVYNNLRTSHANTQILQIAQQVRALYGNMSTTGVAANTDITAQLISAKAVPGDMVNGAAALVDPWPGGATAVIANADGNGFTIVMTAVPNDACINLLMSIAGSNRDPGLYYAAAVATGAVAVGDAVATAPSTSLVATATPALANGPVVTNFGGCNTAAAKKVKFGFGLKS